MKGGEECGLKGSLGEGNQVEVERERNHHQLDLHQDSLG
jgi:hypothetical protein